MKKKLIKIIQSHSLHMVMMTVSLQNQRHWKRHDKQEFELLKKIAQSISQRDKKRQKLDSRTNNAVSTFGCYVTETLAQHINEISFQAQMGRLGQFNSHQVGIHLVLLFILTPNRAIIQLQIRSNLVLTPTPMEANSQQITNNLVLHLIWALKTFGQDQSTNMKLNHLIQ